MLYDYYLPNKGILCYAIEKDELTKKSYISIRSGVCLPADAALEIPSKIKNDSLGKTLPVREIGEKAFKDKNIASVVLPETIKTIGPSAFSYSSIESINLPEGLTDLGASAFKDCYCLEEITIPSTLDIIRERTFDGCNNLRKINFTEGLKHIFNSAFKYVGVSSLNFPDSLTVIGESAFEYCSVEDIKFGKGLVTIHSEAFYDCSQLKTVKFQEGISEICDGAFCECKNLISFILPDSLQKLNNEALDGCRNLTHVHLGKNTEITESLDFCFSCNSLEKITVSPENKQYYIKDHVLYDSQNKMLIKACPCSPVSRIVVPPDIKDVCSYAFQGLKQINSIRFQCDELPNIAHSSLTYITPKEKFKVFCKPNSEIEKYCKAQGIKCNSASKISEFLSEKSDEISNDKDAKKI